MVNKKIRSPLFYVGDKYKLIKEIKEYFPTNISNFIEPFAGGGSVFMNIEAESYFLNDIDKHVFGLHKFLIEQAKNSKLFFEQIDNLISKYGLSCSYKEDIVPKEVKEKWKKTYYAHFNKTSFERLKKDFNNSDETDMFHFYVLLIFGFNRMIRFNSSGEYNLPVGNVDFNKNVVTALNDYFQKVKNKKISWFNLDYQCFVNSIKVSKNDFIYFDPPYLITFSEYNKLWNEEKEIAFIEFLNALDKKKIKFAVSNVTQYKDRENMFFNNWAKNHNVIPIKSNYISYHDNSIKTFNEVLVTNYGTTNYEKKSYANL
ncbi:MAG: Dam family site-specific DNA-(adenine-N6)-methyltransferase [Saprospiraceae bacterium]|nr:Dam family site-specific DNA-(adenine-N6)-methyltransferase [Saprospiraceae bacterium]